MASLEKKAAVCYKTLYRSLQTNCEPYDAGGKEPAVCMSRVRSQNGTNICMAYK